MKNIFDLNPSMLSEIISDDEDSIPIFTSFEEELLKPNDIPNVVPILPLRNTVLFPGVVIPITVGRDKSLRLIKDAYSKKKLIGVTSQKNPDIDDPAFDDLNRIGTIAYILKILKMPDETTTVIIQGKNRIEIKDFVDSDPYYTANVVSYGGVNKLPKTKQFQALISSIKDISIQIIKLSPNIPSDSAFAVKNIDNPVFVVNFISSNLNVSPEVKQSLLEIPEITERANKVLELLTSELQMLEIKDQIQSKVKTDIDKQQRDYYLNQQLKTIQEELGGTPSEQEIKELQEKAKNKKWTEAVAEIFKKELAKLQRMHPSASEYSVQMNYLEVLVELPWGELSEDNFDLKHAFEILDEDHYGLEKVKERIIEYIAVLKLKGDMKSPILCLVGPPGVGKTSLGKSIARALNRKYVRMSLGGLRDESEIRGHRKTYIGAMPGRIIQSLRKAKTSNPVFVLDEIDKVSGMTVSGDPQAALLEVLDPEQNVAFYDNFLEIEYDLSKVLFIATANTLSTIHPALRDRLEIIELSGYIMEEKLEIALKHLLPKQLKEHGVTESQIKINNNIIEHIIENYTRESGVRALEKTIARVIRYNARFIASNEKYDKKVSQNILHKILGPEMFQHEKSLTNEVAGVATGLAWTSFGGEILFIEVSLSKGKGALSLTGSLGDVMKESATIAYEYLKSHSQKLDIKPDVFKDWNVHIHVPEGATPKDGPSAGITMFSALASAFTQRKVKEKIAMTGEITLRGKVLPVGGIKEKILAAKRAEITDIILSTENKKNIAEIPEKYIKGITFHYVENMFEVINIALLKEKVKEPLLFD